MKYAAYGLVVASALLGQAAYADEWASLATRTTIENDRICYSDATDIICDSSAPTLTDINSLVSSGGGLWTASGSDIYYTAGAVGIGINPGGVPLRVYSSSDITGSSLGVFQADNTSGSADRSQVGILGKTDTTNHRFGMGIETDIQEAYLATKLKADGTTPMPLRFDINNNEKMRIDSSGNVGIGTMTPAYPLTVNGRGDFSGLVRSTNASGISFNAGGALLGSATGAAGALHYSYPNMVMTASSGFGLLLQTNGVDAVQIDTDGNVGIGTTSPASLLDVQGTGGNSSISLRSGGNFSWWQLRAFNTGNNPGNLEISSNNSGYTPISIDGVNSELQLTGLVSVGDPSPDANFEISVNGETGGNAFLVSSDDDADGDLLTLTESGNLTIAGDLSVGGSITGTVATDTIMEGDTAVEAVDTGTDGVITFDIDGVEVAQFDNSGELKIAYPGNNNGALYVADGSAQEAFSIVPLNTTLAGVELRGGQNSNFNFTSLANGADEGFRFFNAAGDEQFTILKSGNVGIGTSTPGARFEVSGTADSYMRFLDTAGYTGASAGALELMGYYNTSKFGLYLDNSGKFNIGYNNTGDPLLTISGIGDVTGKGGARLSYVNIVGAPGFSFSNDPNTGMYSTGSDVLGFSTNATERMRIDADGNVGIGTTAPASELDVAGTIRAEQLCDETGANCTDLSAGIGGSIAADSLNFTDLADSLILDATTDIATLTNDLTVNTDDFVIDGATGKVGIGTSTPSSALTVVSTNGASQGEVLYGGNGSPGRLRLGNFSGQVYLEGTSNALALTDGTTNTIDGTSLYVGNVGIGTTSPSSRLHVYGSEASALKLERSSSNPINILLTNTSGDLGTLGYTSGAEGNGAGIGAIASGVATAFVSGYKNSFWVGADGSRTEAMRIAENGNVGIGDNSADAHLEVSVNGGTGGNAFLVSSDDDADGDLLTLTESGNLTIAGDLSVGGSITGTIATDTIMEGDTGVEAVDTGTDGVITFDIDGAEVAQFSNEGRFGIGTSTPDAKLDVEGDIQLASTGSNICADADDIGRMEFKTGKLYICTPDS